MPLLTELIVNWNRLIYSDFAPNGAKAWVASSKNGEAPAGFAGSRLRFRLIELKDYSWILLLYDGQRKSNFKKPIVVHFSPERPG
jgi:hypothetical protein